jgi:hypothetical protein
MKGLAWISLLLGACMLFEQVRLYNVFSLVGSSHVMPELRDGTARAQGPFAHQLCAGAFTATLPPLFLLLWRRGKSKLMAAAGIIGATAAMYATNSSTSLLAYAAWIVGLLLWPIRGKMRIVRRGLVGTLIVLHLVMKAPVWFLIAHIDLTGGSSGYHRANVIDQFMQHFKEWWLIGVKATGNWGWDMWDTQNQFVTVGENGGLVALLFFIATLARCYKDLGNARKRILPDKTQEWQFWLLGTTLFAHIVAFFGVNYYDQSRIGLFLILTLIAATTAPILQAKRHTRVQAAAPASSSWPAYAETD